MSNTAGGTGETPLVEEVPTLQDHIRGNFAYIILPSNLVGVRTFCVRGEYEPVRLHPEEQSEEQIDQTDLEEYHLSFTEYEGEMYLIVGFHQQCLPHYRRLALECGLSIQRGRPMATGGDPLAADFRPFPLEHSLDLIFVGKRINPQIDPMDELELWNQESQRLSEMQEQQVLMREEEIPEDDGLPEVLLAEDTSE